MLQEDPADGVAAEAPRETGEGETRRWPVWATCLCLLTAGALVGAVGFQIFVAPHWGEPARSRALERPNPKAPEEAQVAVPVTSQTVVAGESATVRWVVTNTGGSTWEVDRYYFASQTAGLPVVPLPKTVAPGEQVTVEVWLMVPEEVTEREAVWVLRGRRGEVPGGRLMIRMRAADV